MGGHCNSSAIGLLFICLVAGARAPKLLRTLWAGWRPVLRRFRRHAQQWGAESRLPPGIAELMAGMAKFAVWFWKREMGVRFRTRAFQCLSQRTFLTMILASDLPMILSAQCWNQEWTPLREINMVPGGKPHLPTSPNSTSWTRTFYTWFPRWTSRRCYAISRSGESRRPRGWIAWSLPMRLFPCATRGSTSLTCLRAYSPIVARGRG